MSKIESEVRIMKWIDSCKMGGARWGLFERK